MVEAAGRRREGKHKLRFYARQFIDSMSPANFAATNPEAMKTAVETQGESMRAGFANLLEDLKRGRISITDETAFEVGRNVAVSKGSVVFENELFQLIQYAPLTDKVAERPLVIVPPCINKFYILDLQPENSFVRFACEQGQTVFLVSWRNPDAELGHITWDDYVETGRDQGDRSRRARSAAPTRSTRSAGAWAARSCRRRSRCCARAATTRSRASRCSRPCSISATRAIWASSSTSRACRSASRRIGKGGIYSGGELGFVFQTLRANDLIWPYVVNNYLKGSAPQAFDLLYWNADSTNLPGPMYAWYLRNMYLENNLCKAGRLSMCGTPVDLGRSTCRAMSSARKKITSCRGRARIDRRDCVGGDTQFVLGASGHIAGVINPASKNKRSYWTDGKLGDDSDAWLESAKSQPGSWWTHWIKWLKPYANETVKARTKLGNAHHKPLEPAPGRYVKARAA